MAETMLGVCEKHQLPLDPRGNCQLCRLSEMPSKPPPAATSRWVGVLLAVLVLGGGAGLAYAMLSQVERAEPERGVRGTRSEANGAVVHLREPQAFERPSSVPLPPPPPSERRAAVAPAPAPLPTEPSPRVGEVSEQEAQDALRQVKIEVYTTAWCGSCRRAREYLDYNGIPYAEYDIDEDALANERLANLNPRKSIPTFEIDDIVQVGFSPENLESRINQAVSRRLAGASR
ncbi:MAG: glutaredoxin domain-containing protein [Myxococcota bacterium]